MGRHRGRRITPFAVKVLGQSLGPHDPSCIKFRLALSFVLSFALGLRAEHALYKFVLSLRPEAELYDELSCMRIELHFQVTQRCCTSSRVDEV